MTRGGGTPAGCETGKGQVWTLRRHAMAQRDKLLCAREFKGCDRNHGRDGKRVRRALKRKETLQFKKELAGGAHD